MHMREAEVVVMTKIIAGYAGSGKTTFANLHPDIAIELDYKNYNVIRDKNGRKVLTENGRWIENFAYPRNFIDDIYRAINYGYEYILVETNPSVLKALLNEGLLFTVIVPKRLWTIRFIQNDYDMKFIAQQRSFGEGWIEEIRANRNNYLEYIELDEDEYISDLF